MSVDSSES